MTTSCSPVIAAGLLAVSLATGADNLSYSLHNFSQATNTLEANPSLLVQTHNVEPHRGSGR